MKRATVFVLPLLSLLFCPSWAATHARVDASNNLASCSVISDNLLKINDSTHVSVRVDADDQSEFAYEWTTTMGTIEGAGDEVKYTAPDNVGNAMITITVRDESGNPICRGSASISTYQQFVILKADDLIDDGTNIISPRWQTFIDYVEERNIKASIGIIGYSLEGQNDEYFSLIKELHNNGSIEFWNHGYNHLLNGVNEDGEIYHEFWNSPYEYQKEHLLRTQTLFKEKLNITSHAFGAPGNAIDSNTVKAIEETEEIEVWLFGDTCSTKFVLERPDWYIGVPWIPDYQQFLRDYDPERDYLVLQIHPNSWDDETFDQFRQSIEFLIEQGVTFTTPFEYYQLLNRKNYLAPAYDYTWTDDFKSSSLDSPWSWINEDASQWSLSGHPRYILRIMMHPGGVGDKNLLLRSAPRGDFEIRTRVIFTPTNNFQIAGLVLYQDNGNYLMLGRAYCDTPPPACVGNGIYFDRVEGGSSVGSNFATSTTTQGEVYLRVIREGTTYSGYHSEDGTSWILIGRHTPSRAIGLSKVGLTAAQGGPEIPADFNCFRLDANYPRLFLPLVVKNY